MRAAFIAHGFVQGVGYRYFVKRVADRLGIRGIVENKSDGSVLIVAEGDDESVERFEAGINISEEHGIQVLRIDKIPEGDPAFPKINYDSSRFHIIR